MKQNSCKKGHPFTPDNTYIRPSNGKRACRICLREKSRGWRKKHPEKVSALMHSWYKKNKDYVVNYNKKWHKEHEEQERVRKRDYARRNLDLGRKNARKRRALKKSKLGLWWHCERMWINILRKVQEDKCYYCYKNIDICLPPQHPDREVLEHPTPLARGGSHGIENWVLACFMCNSKKGRKTALEFLENYNDRKYCIGIETPTGEIL